MTTGEKGLAIIKHYEGFRSKKYICPAGLPTIGYGTVIDTPEEQWLHNATITEAQATELLKKDVAIAEAAVNKLAKGVNQDKFDALVCFTYNCGGKALQNSTLLRKVNANPNDPTIKDEFLKWNRGGGRVLAGLTKRRTSEAELYTNGKITLL